ncbi:enoyl-CoA hydratase-related protein [Actinomadura sp. 3N407]|uniref:enoyl-CoA hydratase-related protein n=1 Tax=Actinomadura sp. 3N407 TaxID=3457423 RepID=UPI003FCD5B39
MTAAWFSEVAPGIGSIRVATDERPYFEETALESLRAAVREVAEDERLHAVLVEGGARRFSAGAPAGVLLADDSDARIERLMSEAGRLLLDVPVPTIAVMSGHAVGGGLMLGLWCDMAVLAEESLYGANFLDLGFTPGMGSTVLAEEAFGAPLGREVLLTGRLIKGRDIRAAGAPIGHGIMPRADVRPAALRLARDIADLPRDAVVLFKRHLAAERGSRLHDALRRESAMHREVLTRPATRRRIAERHPGDDR